MTPKHIYDCEGYWVAFVVGTEVFLRGGEWLGRLIGGNNEVRDQEGRLRALLDECGRLAMVKVEPFQMTVSGQSSSRKVGRDTEKVG